MLEPGPLKQCIRVLLTLLFMDSGDCHISPNEQASFDILTKLSGGEPVAQYWLGDRLGTGAVSFSPPAQGFAGGAGS